MAMLAETGFGVAMGNGEPEVRAMADFVAPSNEDEGVALAVERFALGVERPAWQLAAFRVRNRILYRLRQLARRILRHIRGK